MMWVFFLTIGMIWVKPFDAKNSSLQHGFLLENLWMDNLEAKLFMKYLGGSL